MTSTAAYTEAVALLEKLVTIPSFSKEELETANCIEEHLVKNGVACQRKFNNIWAKNLHFDISKPTILLNSHHDTVKPSVGYKNDPFTSIAADGKLFGLGSNDAGGALVSLITVFKHFYSNAQLPYNLILAATAEEEISGDKGVSCLFDDFGTIDLAVVGEPTGMQMAIAEKGLLVLDCHYDGTAGHAARNEGDNAIYKSLKDLRWFQSFQFEKVSDLLGSVKMSVTQIDSGKNHNVIPDHCHFTVDIRCNDKYSLEEILDTIHLHTQGNILPRSIRLRPSSISTDHWAVKAGKRLGISTFGSSTLSDQALMQYPSLKMGPGDSARSHMADEYIFLEEIHAGILLYKDLLEEMILILTDNKSYHETLG